jgi:hypothetical protein
MPSPPQPRAGRMALAGRRSGRGRGGISGGHLSLSWHHTRSFCRRSRAESEQSRGSFAGRTIIFTPGEGQGASIRRPRRLWICEFESSFPGHRGLFRVRPIIPRRGDNFRTSQRKGEAADLGHDQSPAQSLLIFQFTSRSSFVRSPTSTSSSERTVSLMSRPNCAPTWSAASLSNLALISSQVNGRVGNPG